LQEHQKVKGKKQTPGVTISPIWGHAPTEHMKTKFDIRGSIADVIICFKFHQNQLRGFRAVRGQKWGSLNRLPLQQVSTTMLPAIVQINFKMKVLCYSSFTAILL